MVILSRLNHVIRILDSKGPNEDTQEENRKYNKEKEKVPRIRFYDIFIYSYIYERTHVT